MSVAIELEATRIGNAALPIIDISGLLNGNARQKASVGAALQQACAEYGFFYIVGHGVPAGVIRPVFEQTKKFFDLPDQASSTSTSPTPLAETATSRCGGRRWRRVRRPI